MPPRSAPMQKPRPAAALHRPPAPAAICNGGKPCTMCAERAQPHPAQSETPAPLAFQTYPCMMHHHATARREPRSATDRRMPSAGGGGGIFTQAIALLNHPAHNFFCCQKRPHRTGGSALARALLVRCSCAYVRCLHLSCTAYMPLSLREKPCNALLGCLTYHLSFSVRSVP